MLATSDEVSQKRATFFKFAFGEGEGYICIARRKVLGQDKATKELDQDFFKYPDELDALLDHVNRFTTNHDLWYCPQLWSGRRRRKEFAKETPTAWSDLDGCDPAKLLVKPSIVVESSPGRYQALWRFSEPVIPFDAEHVSRRIAYYHADDGADKSGWDLTQLLRIPFTYNHKYGNIGVAPMVKITAVNKNAFYTTYDFSEYPDIAEYAYAQSEMPEEVEDSQDVMMRYRSRIHPMAFVLYGAQPKDDWSKSLWQLEVLLFESGLSKEEVFAIVRNSACNKYVRDRRGDYSLWKEVCRAYAYYEEREHDKGPSVSFEGAKPLLTDDERVLVEDDPTIVEEYIEWAKGLGDASWQYHQAGIFVILSAILASSVRLPTSFGTVSPNLWFMILADTTLTRKTTSMDIAMGLLEEIGNDFVLATDGSIEGLFQSLSMRPGQSSIFLRDEFSGLLEMMTKRDYYAGMAETLTKMYDGKYQKRVLRRETIEVKDPVLILYTGGIKNRIFELLNFEHVISGFLPRFIFITAEADLTKIKPVGPPTEEATEKREELVLRLSELLQHYSGTNIVTVNGQAAITSKRFNAELTPDAWARYNQIEAEMVSEALGSNHRDVLMPSMDRLAKSGLKVAVLIAASRGHFTTITVIEKDLLHAFYYIEQWRNYALEVLSNIGKSPYEKLADKLERSVQRAGPNGIRRGILMRDWKLTAKQAEELFLTLEQRGLIRRVKDGKSEIIYSVGVRSNG